MCTSLVFFVFWISVHFTSSSEIFELLSSNAKVNDLSCQTEVLKVIYAAKRNEMWAMKIIDASTKIPSGILTGHILDLGNYDECFDNNNNITTQYCSLDLHVENDTKISWSYCIPKSCTPKNLEEAIQNFMAKINLNVSAEVNDCYFPKKITLNSEDYIGIFIWGFFGVLAILSTVYDVFKRTLSSSIPDPRLVSFSLYTNALGLLNTKVKDDAMAPLYGLRFLSICWVILGHRCFFTLQSSLINLNDYVKELNKIRSQIFIQGVLAVDTFFLMSGLLNCYHLLGIINTTNQFPFFKYYIHRYLRLTPVLAAVVLMYATWYTLIGDGPLWFKTTSQWKQLCIDHWWPTLIYINNYYNPLDQCAGQSWYLAVDMQLYWLSPFVVLPLWKWPKYGKIGLWLLLTASTLSVFIISYIYEFRASFNFGFESFDEFKNTTKLIYVPTHTRASPYIIGMILGYYLYSFRKSKRILVFKKKWIVFNWFLSTMICLSVLFGNYQFIRPIEDHPYNRIESSLYISLHRLGWGFGVSWIIFSCLNNMGGIINFVLSWKAFVPLGRLTYCIFLTHMAIQQYQIGTSRTSDYFQYFDLVHRFLGDICVSVFFAGVLSLIFESPIMVLEKLISKKSHKNNAIEAKSNDGYQNDLEAENRKKVFSNT